MEPRRQPGKAALRRRGAPVALLAGFLLAAGCAGIGPRSLEVDRPAYSLSVGESWKREALLNVVRLRYLDVPVFMKISSIVNGYTRKGSVRAGFHPADLPDSLDLGGDISFEERPTISYDPVAGDEFTAMLEPLPLTIPLALVESGWRADLVLRMTCQSINGIRARERSPDGRMKESPRFRRVLDLVRQVQESDALGIEVLHREQAHDTIAIYFREDCPDPGARAAIRELRGLLGLAPEVREFRLSRSVRGRDGGTIVLRTRSVVQILGEFAACVEVPPADREAGYATDGVAPDEDSLVRIHSGDRPPREAHVVIRYGGHYFWISRDDLRSKLAFGYLLAILRAAGRSGAGGGPVLTIPTG